MPRRRLSLLLASSLALLASPAAARPVTFAPAPVSGSALVPSFETTEPLTVTRPSTINRSAARRDAIPAADRIFWSRILLR